MDYCKYADVFYGNGEVDHFAEEGLASKWFYIKALCGNTTPHAALPFGKMSVGAYSGGYPTGYGTHNPNSCGGIYKISEVQKIRGFSHLHQSGTGAIGFYYNYAVVTPFYGGIESINEFLENTNEQAKPGFYSTLFNDVLCEFTVNKNTAVHKYSFKKSGGRIAVDFSNNGCLEKLSAIYHSKATEAGVAITPTGEIVFNGVHSGVRLYFCVKVEAPGASVKLFEDNTEKAGIALRVSDTTKSFGAVIDFEGDEAVVKVSYSTVSPGRATENVMNCTDTFEETAAKAYEVWNQHLSRIEIESDDEVLKEKFYSNLYHSLIKPVDMTGEALLGIKDDLVTDFATFWDQYKTALPLILAVYPDMGEKIARAIINTSKTLGRVPCSIVLADKFPCEEQAKMLGVITLLNAFHYGIKSATVEEIEECIKREIALESNKSFRENGIFERCTHILDAADACCNVADITEDAELKKQLLALADNWKKAYGEDGLMSENSVYYEGDRITYSFRLHRYMEERIALAGGKENFVKLLDSFFGFDGESIKQLTHKGADAEINATHYHRFQGFNNECDLEAPYAYVYADRHDRTCEIVDACINQSFSTGKGGLPGNNDSGGISACFVWNALGLFPATGNGEFLLGSPHVDKAKIKLSNGKILEIEAVNKGIYVKKVTFNGEKINNFRIPAEKLMRGGKLVFEKK